MTDYNLICRGRVEGGLTCSCKTLCGIYSDVLKMEEPKTFQNVIGKNYPTVLLRGQVILVLLFSSSRPIVQKLKLKIYPLLQLQEQE